MQAIIAWVIDALYTIAWLGGAWLLIYLFVLYRTRWQTERLEPTYSVDEFIAAANGSVSIRKIKKMIPHVRRRTIDEIRRLNVAAINRNPNLLHHVQASDHDPVY